MIPLPKMTDPGNVVSLNEMLEDPEDMPRASEHVHQPVMPNAYLTPGQCNAAHLVMVCLPS